MKSSKLAFTCNEPSQRGILTACGGAAEAPEEQMPPQQKRKWKNFISP